MGRDLCRASFGDDASPWGYACQPSRRRPADFRENEMAGKLKHPEDDLQRLCADMLYRLGPANLPWWHTPSGAQMNRLQAARMKGFGWRTGVHDIVALPVLTCELKAPGAPLTLSPDQEEFAARVQAWGGHWTVQNSVEGVYDFFAQHVPMRGRLSA